MKESLAIRRIRNYIGLKVMRFFIKRNFRLVNMTNERMVEYPWVLMRCRLGKGKIADFGCRGSLLVPYLSSLGYEVYGIDLNEGFEYSTNFLDHYLNYKFVNTDMRTLPFGDNFFDLSFSISTLEHIFSPGNVAQDKDALKEIIRTTKQGGQIFITMPYGKGEVSREYLGYPYKIYNKTNLAKFLEFPNLKIEEIDYFIKRYPVWLRCRREDIEDIDSSYEPCGTVCVSLTKI